VIYVFVITNVNGEVKSIQNWNILINKVQQIFLNWDNPSMMWFGNHKSSQNDVWFWNHNHPTLVWCWNGLILKTQKFERWQIMKFNSTNISKWYAWFWIEKNSLNLCQVHIKRFFEMKWFWNHEISKITSTLYNDKFNTCIHHFQHHNTR